MKLLTEDPTTIGSGDYNARNDLTSGENKLQYSVDGGAFRDVPDSAVTSSSTAEEKDYILTLPNCRVQSVITGDGDVWLDTVEDKSDKATKVTADT